MFIIGDEPVIISVEGVHVEHHPDCFMTDEEYEEYAAKLVKQRRRKESRRYRVSREVHRAPTQPRGVGSVLVTEPVHDVRI